MSGSVFLSNLDDFIALSQACVNPLVSSKLEKSDTNSSKPTKLVLSNDLTRSEFDEVAVQPNLIKTKVSLKSKVATVSLNDCLACSGCVTSAETMLIQEQSYEKLLTKLSQCAPQNSTIVVAISPNSRTSIANFLGMDTSECFLRIATALKKLGVKYVVDAASAGDIALMEAREEFLKRYNEGHKKQWTKPITTTAISSTDINIFQTQASNSNQSSYGEEEDVPLATASKIGIPTLHSQLPVLTSHCPGWICYAEKTQPQVIPYISTVKSAQQILGTVIKQMPELKLLSKNDVNNSSSEINSNNNNSSSDSNSCCSSHEIYFVSIQPCFDKKLESSRLDFYHREAEMVEVDLVLSTTELWRLLEAAAATVVTSNNDHTIHNNDNAKNRNSNNDDNNNNNNDDDQVAIIRTPSYTSDIQGTDNGESNDTISMTVSEYLLSLTPDLPHGCDDIEHMFRCYTSDGLSLVAASDSNGSSGGYAEYIFKYAAEQLYGINLWNRLAPLPFIEGRNPDITEIDINNIVPDNTMSSSSNSNSIDVEIATATTSTVSRKLKFGRAYGFRNIQSVLMKLRRRGGSSSSGGCELDFIEIMACPSGCNNGGGQIRQQTIATTTTTITPSVSSVSLSTSSKSLALLVPDETISAQAVLAATTASSSSMVSRNTTTISNNASTTMESPAQSRERINQLEQLFHKGIHIRKPDDSMLAQYLYSPERLRSPLSAAAIAMLHTRYHAVPKLEVLAPLAAKW